MNAKEYDNFLIETASKIDTLTVKPSNRQHFQKQVNHFLDRFNKWYEAFKNGIEQAKKNPNLFAGKMPVDDGTDEFIDNDVDGKWLQNVRRKCPAGYEVVNPSKDYYPYVKEVEPPAGYYYRQPLPLNPLDTLIPKDDFNTLFPDNKKEIPMIEATQIDKQEEDVLRKYYLLAVIHSHKGHSTPFIDKESYPAVLVWNVYEDLNDTKKEIFWGKHIEALMNNAVLTVEANIDGRKPNENNRNLSEIKSRFKIEQSRILFDDKDLNLSTGKMIEVAKNLIENFDNIVKYTVLDGESTEKEASDNLRKYKSIFDEAIKKLKIPCKISTKKQAGYMLTTK